MTTMVERLSSVYTKIHASITSLFTSVDSINDELGLSVSDIDPDVLGSLSDSEIAAFASPLLIDKKVVGPLSTVLATSLHYVSKADNSDCPVDVGIMSAVRITSTTTKQIVTDYDSADVYHRYVVSLVPGEWVSDKDLFTTLQNSITAVSGVATANATNITNLTSTVGTNTDNISALTASLSTLSSAVSVLAKGSKRVTAVNNQTGTSYTATTADEGGLIRMNNASANTVTIPLESAQAFSDNCVIAIRQVGAGATTIVAASGVRINSTSLVIHAQYATVQLIKVGTNTWDLVGAEAVAS